MKLPKPSGLKKLLSQLKISKLNDADRAGLYVTIIIHLVVLIVLLAVQIGASLGKENSFLMDFTREEALEKERLEEEERLKQEAWEEEIRRRNDELIAGASGIKFKNVVVDRSALKDDRGTDAEQLYKEAEELERELKDAIAPDPDDDYAAPAPIKKEDERVAKEYSGPSVVSYQLDGRKASSLPIPAYRCYNGGMVTVIITVDNAGTVTNAKVQDETSSGDSCLRNFAIRAARLSRFSADPKAPAKQYGNIVYQFIAQ